MTVIRDRADARWLPSRFDFALFRLFAYFRLRTMRPEPKQGIALSVERHQSAIENYLIPLCVLVVIAAFMASLIASMLPLEAAFLIALPATAVLITAQMVLTGLAITPLVRKLPGMTGASRITVNAAVLSAMAITAAALLAASATPLRHIGTAYLMLLAANALASVVVFLMRRRIADLERRCGVEP
ncbi:MAG TPA: hypothetical protein VIM68_04220 [Thermoanaerobaculia bacterium]